MSKTNGKAGAGEVIELKPEPIFAMALQVAVQQQVIMPDGRVQLVQVPAVTVNVMTVKQIRDFFEEYVKAASGDLGAIPAIRRWQSAYGDFVAAAEVGQAMAIQGCPIVLAVRLAPGTEAAPAMAVVRPEPTTIDKPNLRISQ